MTRKIDVKQKYKQLLIKFSSYPKFVSMPYVTIVLKNLDTGEVGSFTSDFLVDTGACISVINSRHYSFIKNMPIIDRVEIQYGQGKVKLCDVYRIGLIAKGGEEFEAHVAYDDACPYSVLGHHKFMENIHYNIFDSLNKHVRFLSN